MALSIELQNLPSQEFTITLSENEYEIRIFSIVDGMAYDLILNEKVIISGFLMVNQVLLLPYKYQEISGNLLLVVPDDEDPNYKQFGLTQFLYFLDDAETEEYRLKMAEG